MSKSRRLRDFAQFVHRFADWSFCGIFISPVERYVESNFSNDIDLKIKLVRNSTTTSPPAILLPFFAAAMEPSPRVAERLARVRHCVAVLSGKGGVGKSTVCTQLALNLHLRGFNVGVLDVDLCGPSIPRIFGVSRENLPQATSGILPVIVSTRSVDSPDGPRTCRLVCLSVGFLLKSDSDAVVWRGPRKHVMIRQFLEDVVWGELDFLLIDTPPGTSDEHISIFQLLPSSRRAVIVTQPQKVALADVRKEISFCRKMNVAMLGVVENMSGFACPCCREVTHIFAVDGGRQLCTELGLPFLGAIPLDARVARAEDGGDISWMKNEDGEFACVAAERIHEITTLILSQLEGEEEQEDL